jgi:hypothetical protein
MTVDKVRERPVEKTYVDLWTLGRRDDAWPLGIRHCVEDFDQ